MKATFEQAKSIIIGFRYLDCKAYVSGYFNSYGMSVFNPKEYKTAHIDIVHPEKGLIEFLSVSYTTIKKLKKDFIL